MSEKPKNWNHLTVLPHDSMLRFRVRSKSRPDIEHVVDLAAYRKNGECSCEHFQFRLAPEIKANPGQGVRQCIHIQAARAALADIVIDRVTNPHHGES